MKLQAGSGRLSFFSILALATAGFVSQAQIVTLLNANSTASINFGSQAGMYSWLVDGQSQLNQQWFWYRVDGMAGQLSIDTIGAPSLSNSGANTITATYNGAGFNLGTIYTLTGGQTGSGKSDIGESIRINNLTSTNISFHFYQYSDFTLGGTPQDDTTTLGKSISGKFNEALVSDGVHLIKETVDTVTSPGADEGEVALQGLTRASLNGGTNYVLNGNAGPLGPGYYTWALEWDLNIDPGGSVLISKDKNLQVLVPEPSAVILVSLGMLAWRLRRKLHA
jgi:hypothetical protein